MSGYAKGTTARGEMTAMREAAARAGLAMQSDPDIVSAFQDATDLEKLGQEISREASDFRAWFAAYLHDSRKVPQAEIARMLRLHPSRVGQLVAKGREKEGNPMTDPGTLPVLLPVVVAVVTSDKGVLIAHRVDRRPEWTFPGGDLASADESPADALRRRVPEETGITVKPTLVFGERIHPRTNRHMIYMACTPENENDEPTVGPAASADLDAVEWAGLDTIRARMPDMYEPVLAHLETTLTGAGRI